MAKKHAKKRHFGQITAFTAFDENHGFRDFRVSAIIYCPYECCSLQSLSTPSSHQDTAHRNFLLLRQIYSVKTVEDFDGRTC